MDQQPSGRRRGQGRLGAAADIALLLFSLWPISLAASNGHWGLVALLVVLDLALIAVPFYVRRRRATMSGRPEQQGAADGQ